MSRLLFLAALLPQACFSLLLFCPNTCRYGNQTFCGHIPCPLPPCDEQLVQTVGDCCQHCPNPPADAVVTADPCPANCTIGGKHYCFPVPCPLPPCVDPIKTPGDCCDHCPNGPNCRHRGIIIPQGKSHLFSDEDCSCRFGGSLGGVECSVV